MLEQKHANIVVKIIADSISIDDGRITTFQLDYPRFIHSELMTHRVFSRNAASSRAIPIDAVINLVATNSAKPIHWGKNQGGMQAKEELDQPNKVRVQSLWQEAADGATYIATQMKEQGAHKQIVNRILEPFQIIRVLVTATEFDNWFYLRYHADAQPEIAKLAELMYEVYTQNSPELLSPGEWHTPFVEHKRNVVGVLEYWSNNAQLSKDEALKVSSSCCAQVSYRKSDDSLEKAEMVFKRLIESKPCHASPTEHQATPMKRISFDCNAASPFTWEEGVTHMDKTYTLWSGNFKEWIQHRQLIPNNVCTDFVKEN